ncbi:MAG: hypothetical protein IPJ88_12825 [Myxococcales bacterium]|nr:MAG: hypothetical protein IPJ88_12825 [Myxococcales bacterium]
MTFISRMGRASFLGLLAVVAFPALGMAQMTVKVTAIEGRTGGTTTLDPLNNPISLAECTSGTNLTFVVRNIPTDKNSLSVWTGSSGIPCNDVENRNSNTTQPKCHLVEGLSDLSINGSSTKEDFIIPADALRGACDNTEGVLYILAIDTNEYDAVDANSYATLNFRIDVDPPGNPSSLQDASGDTAVGLNWEQLG